MNIVQRLSSVLTLFAMGALLMAPGVDQNKNYAQAQTVLAYRGVDVMKYTKDTVHNQPSDQEIEQIVNAVAGLNPTHIAISVPLDPSGDYPQTPYPRSAEEFARTWADAIHAAGKKVIFRGTWSGIEGIYGFEKRVGGNRLPAGTAASAPADGTGTWLGKTYRYILDNQGLFQDGDVWAVLPERTEGIFQDSTSFLPHDGAGIQANYADFFNDLKAVSDRAFGEIGRDVATGLTANNYTEAASGWLPGSVFQTAGMVVVDHYGSGGRTAEEMEADLRKIHGMHGQPVFLQEWGDYWNAGLPLEQRLEYLSGMYGMLQRLADENILVGFNYWGGWVNDLEGILTNDGGYYGINERGTVLADFYRKNGAGGIVESPEEPSSGGPAEPETETPDQEPDQPSEPVWPGNGKKRGWLKKTSLQSVRHDPGSVVLDPIDGQTAYFLGQEIRYPFPDAQTFLSWGHRFEDLALANDADLSLPTGPEAPVYQ